MSYYDEAVVYIKKLRPADMPEFESKFAAGKAKILGAEHLFRLMSPEESEVWNRVAPPGAKGMTPSLMQSLFVGGGGYTSKWFTFDRPYLFNRQKLNEPGKREGQTFLMTLPLGQPVSVKAGDVVQVSFAYRAGGQIQSLQSAMRAELVPASVPALV